MDQDETVEHAEGVSDDGQYLTFTLADQSFALDALHIREIRSWSAPTPLPHAAPEVLGAMNLRGAIIPVIDLRIQLGVSQPQYDGTTGVVVVQAQIGDRLRQMGLVVDRVLNVTPLDSIGDEAIDRDISEVSSRFVVGLAKCEEALVILLDLEAIMIASLEQGLDEDLLDE